MTIRRNFVFLFALGSAVLSLEPASASECNPFTGECYVPPFEGDVIYCEFDDPGDRRTLRIWQRAGSFQLTREPWITYEAEDNPSGGRLARLFDEINDSRRIPMRNRKGEIYSYNSGKWVNWKYFFKELRHHGFRTTSADGGGDPCLGLS